MTMVPEPQPCRQHVSFWGRATCFTCNPHGRAVAADVPARCPHDVESAAPCEACTTGPWPPHGDLAWMPESVRVARAFELLERLADLSDAEIDDMCAIINGVAADRRDHRRPRIGAW